MFEKLGRLAEGLATGVGTSRRGFLGRVGRSAMGVAGAMGALAVASGAQTGGVVCCKYACKYSQGYYGGWFKDRNTYTVCLAAGSTCPSSNWNCHLLENNTRSDCSKC
jgi:hypothetical protein